MEARFFRTPSALRRWLDAHHDDTPEIWIGLFKKASGKKGVTYQEALDEALCYGWIDGLTRRLDDERYAIRFTPRKRGSLWSAVNTKRVGELIELGRMNPAGLAAFERRDKAKTNRYSFEQARVTFTAAQEKMWKANPKARDFFKVQAPSYQKASTWWVVSAKKEETRERRLEALIDHSARGRRLPQLTPPARRSRAEN